MQIPPIFSAIKIEGKKAYELARSGKAPELKPRKIVVYKIDLLEYKFPVLKIRTKVSSGTYIRSLARDMGRKLGCGAYLHNLRRIKIGKYKVEDSVALNNLNMKNIKDYTLIDIH
jgi:tRNA pseudouridine55 synthase